MPGARPYGYWVGDNAELFAQYVLSNFSFATPILRQDDVGHDFYCVLSESEGNLLRAGPFFTVQVKNGKKDLIYEKAHEIEWIKKQDNPFFVCVSNRGDQTVEIYSTWNRLNGFLLSHASKIILSFQPLEIDYPNAFTKPDKSEQFIPLGKPILKVSIHDILDNYKKDELKNILKRWIEIDRENIVNSQTGMFWVVGPQKYQTNVLPNRDDDIIYFFWNPRNFEKCRLNFGRAATALRVVTKALIAIDESIITLEGEKLKRLDEALIAYSDILDPLAKKVLKDEIGLFTDKC